MLYFEVKVASVTAKNLRMDAPSALAASSGTSNSTGLGGIRLLESRNIPGADLPTSGNKKRMKRENEKNIEKNINIGKKWEKIREHMRIQSRIERENFCKARFFHNQLRGLTWADIHCISVIAN